MSKLFKLTMLQAIDELGKLDSDIKRVIADYGYPRDRMMPPTFETIARIIIGQQISRQVAEALWKRLEEQQLTSAQHIHMLDPDRLMQVGLSRRKSEYIIGIAQAITDASLDLNWLGQQDGETIQLHLTSYRGVGIWTADNFRLFALQDFDAWPGGDLALQEAMKTLKELPARPTNAEMGYLSQTWSPYRGAGALMLWHLYAKTKLNGQPI
jgi:DNA-3-methyladenine glycosylase II